MTTILGILVLALGLSVVMTLLMIRVSVGFGVLDRPDATRHLHARPIPKLGGVAVFVAFSLPIMLLVHMEHITFVAGSVLREFVQVWGLLAGGAVVLAVGLVDDVFDLRPRWKILWQVVGASVAYYAGFAITSLSVPLLGAIDLGSLSLPITVLWFLMCMNAINLLDGHDGLASGACLFVCLTLMLVSINSGNILGAILMASFAGSVLGFLFFNFPPARIFLGDSGSLVLGFLIAGLSLVGATMKAETAFSLLVPVVAMGLPFFDTTFAIMRRMYARMPISTGDRGHLHHILGRLGYSPRKVVLTLYAVTMALCALAFVVTVSRNEIVLMVVLVLLAVAFVTVRIAAGISPGQMLGRYVGDKTFKGRVLKSRLQFESRIDAIESAPSVEDAWAICGTVLKGVGVSQANIAYHKGTESAVLSWPKVGKGAPHGVSKDWRLCVPFGASSDISGQLEIGLREADHSLAALPEFIGLIERMRAVLLERIARHSTKGRDDVQAASSIEKNLHAEKPAVPGSFTQRAARHVRRYGLVHAAVSFAGRFIPGLWKTLGPVVTTQMIHAWLATPQAHLLNLGGGSNCIEGCLTVDVDPRAEVYLDVTQPFPIPSEAVDGIFCEEVVEHVSEDDARDMLLECLRIMKPGGIIRLVTPDLDYLASKASGGPVGEQQINEAFLKHEHMHVYSRRGLVTLVASCGFEDVTLSSYQGGDARLGFLDSHADRFSHPPEISQYVEARKPDTTGG